MRQAREMIPVVIIRGLEYEWCDCGLSDSRIMGMGDLLRALKESIRYSFRVIGFLKVLKKILL